ncbi:MAG TPA: hypothetical protein VHD56_13120 [Tepidisphaeraceae bacterium]|nr:hypothetical protein [Tepidisphaeraceae bacterium]
MKRTDSLIRVYLCLTAVSVSLIGCTSRPNQANIELRKRIQTMDAQMAGLQRQHEADAASLRAIEQQRGTLQTLPQDKLDKLFTTAGVSIGRLSGPAEFDSQKPGEDGITVYATPIDQQGDSFKASGSFVVELLDPKQQPDKGPINKWEFTLEQSQKSWRGMGLLYAYVLNCPWQEGPQPGELLLKVTFHDELTQREFSAQKTISIKPK